MADDPRYSDERLAELSETNGAKERSLIADGVEFRPELAFRLTVMVLKDMLLEGDPAAQREFEVRYQEQFAETLTDAQERLNRAKLTSNGKPGPRLLRPGQG